MSVAISLLLRERLSCVLLQEFCYLAGHLVGQPVARQRELLVHDCLSALEVLGRGRAALRDSFVAVLLSDVEGSLSPRSLAVLLQIVL